MNDLRIGDIVATVSENDTTTTIEILDVRITGGYTTKIDGQNFGCHIIMQHTTTVGGEATTQRCEEPLKTFARWMGMADWVLIARSPQVEAENVL